MQVTSIAVILGLILVLLIGLLFVPLTYSVDMITRAPLRFRFKAGWLGRIFSVRAAYEQGRPFSKEVYIAGKLRVGAVKDYEKWLSKRVKEETDMADEDNESDQEELQRTEVEVKADWQQTDAAADRQDTGSEANRQSTGLEGGRQSAEPEAGQQQTRLEADEQSTGPGDSRQEPASEDEPQAAKPDRGESSKDAAKQEKKPQWWRPYITELDLYRQVLLFVRKVYDHSKPRDFTIEGVLGIGDPCYTGMLAGLLYSVWPDQVDEVSFDFLGISYEGSSHIGGRIYPAALIWYTICLLVKKPVRGLIRAAIKGGKA